MFCRRFLAGLGCAFIVMSLLAPVPAAFAENSAVFRSTARLFGENMRGQVRFEQQIRSGRLFRQMRIDIFDAPALRTFPIIVNGTLLTTVTTNPNGRARVIVTSPEFFNNVRDGIPMPDEFPTLRTGDVVVVGRAVGIMFDRHGGAGIDPPERVQAVVLRGDLVGTRTEPMEGTIEFRATLVNGRPLERSFIVNLVNAPPQQEVLINFNRSVIATGFSDPDGNAVVALRTPGFIIDPFDEFPMVGTFPSMQAGDVVLIGGSRVRLVPGTGGTIGGGSGGGTTP